MKKHIDEVKKIRQFYRTKGKSNSVNVIANMAMDLLRDLIVLKIMDL